MNLKQKIDTFKKLSFENKKLKVLKILEILKGWSSFFDDIYDIIKNLDVSEELLVSTYISIENAIENIKKEDLKKDISSIKNIKNKLEKIKKLEEKLKENPEDLLKNI